MTDSQNLDPQTSAPEAPQPAGDLGRRPDLVRRIAGRRGSIRRRLLTTSLLSSVLLAFAITNVFVIVSFNSGREQAITQLNLLAALEEERIDAWATALQRELRAIFPGGQASQNAEIVIREVPDPAEPQPLTDMRYALALEELTTRFDEAIEQVGLYDEIFLMDTRGYVVLSTDPAQIGKFRRNYSYFQQGIKGPYLQSPFHYHTLSRGDFSVVASRPLLDDLGEVVGVVAASASLSQLDLIIQELTDAYPNIDIYLLSSDHVLLSGEVGGAGRYEVFSQGADRAIDAQESGADTYRNHLDTSVLGAYRWLPQIEVALMAEQSQLSAYTPVLTALLIDVAVGVAVTAVVAAAALVLTRSITTPLDALARTAQQIAGGNLELSAPVERDDETGALARAFNSMTDRLRILISGLEQRVTERTVELERRSRYLEAAAQVSRAVGAILEPDVLITRVVQLIQEQYDLYYVGLFLTDAEGEWAELKAGTGAAGQAMLARRHRIRVGEGMVGWSVLHSEPRVALDVGEDAVRLSTAELPETRSEAAIPLASRGRVLGALTVQDRRPNAFDRDAIAALEAMADQVAVALDNARLFEERQVAIETERRVFSAMQGRVWAQLQRERADLGFLSRAQGVAPAERAWRPEMIQAVEQGRPVQNLAVDGDEGQEARTTLAIPVKIQDKVVAVLDTYKPAGAGDWSEEELAFLTGMAEQLSVALENARLYESTQRRVDRERTISDITAKVRAAGDVDNILRTAVLEIRRALGTTHGVVRLGTETHLLPPEEAVGADPPSPNGGGED